MDFLRRLAPAGPGDTTWAVAALPPRFAAERPLRADVQPPEEGAESSFSDPDVLVEVGRDAKPAEANMDGKPELASADPERAAPVVGRQPVGPLRGAGQTASRAVRAPAPSRPPDCAEPGQNLGGDQERGPLSRGIPVALGRSANAVAASPIRSTNLRTEELPAAVPTARAPSGPPRVAPARVGPLSSATLASRASHGAVQRPVIHVTIDRIEVRAPTPAQRPTLRPRAVATPAVSLSDYLRGGSGASP